MDVSAICAAFFPGRLAEWSPDPIAGGTAYMGGFARPFDGQMLPMESEVSAKRGDLAMAAIRAERDFLLKETDWVVPVTDHPKHGAYLSYRQALRDYPETVVDPHNPPPWPERP